MAALLTASLLTATIGVVTGVGAVLVLSLRGVVGGAELTPELTWRGWGAAFAIVYGTLLIVSVPLGARAARMAPTEAIRTVG